MKELQDEILNKSNSHNSEYSLNKSERLEIDKQIDDLKIHVSEIIEQLKVGE